jgi:hypothetical protein
MNALRYSLILPTVALVLTGCQGGQHAPTLDVLGSYFPAWVVCIVLGLILTLITRQVLIGFKINSYLHPIALVYVCMMVFYTLSLWLLFFQN